MAQPDLIPFVQRNLLLSLRAVPGTAVVPSPTSHAIMLFNGQSGTEIDVVERPVDRKFYGGAPFGVTNKRAFIEGEIELYAPQSPGKDSNSDSVAHAILLPAGLTAVKNANAKTTRYSPVSEGIAVSDAYFYHAGTLKKVIAARHNLSAVTMEIGKRFTARVRIEGGYDDVSEASMPNVSLPGNIPQVADSGNTSARISINGGSLLVRAKSLTVEVGNQITRRNYTEYSETGITSRQPKWSMRIARTSLADFNPWEARDTCNIISASFLIRESGNYYSRIFIRGQIEQVNEIDQDGDYGWEISGRCIPTSVGGNEFHIEFGDTSP